MADFNFYLNRQGVQGRQGERGATGFSPIISELENTRTTYKLSIQNESFSFETPNLRPEIADGEGSYIRINEDGLWYIGDPTPATETDLGTVILATTEDFLNQSDSKVTTPSVIISNLHNFLLTEGAIHKEVAEDGTITLSADDFSDEINALRTAIERETTDRSNEDVRLNGLIERLRSDLTTETQVRSTTDAQQQIAINSKISADNIIAGENITINRNGNDIIINSTGGGGGEGDVTAAGNNTFTGINTFKNTVELDNELVVVNRNNPRVLVGGFISPFYNNGLTLQNYGSNTHQIVINDQGIHLGANNLTTVNENGVNTHILNQDSVIGSETIDITKTDKGIVLNANLDEIGGEVNALANRVTTNESAIESLDERVTDLEEGGGGGGSVDLTAGDALEIINGGGEGKHTTLNVFSSNPSLEIINNYSGTQEEVGTKTEILTYGSMSTVYDSNEYFCSGNDYTDRNIRLTSAMYDNDYVTMVVVGENRIWNFKEKTYEEFQITMDGVPIDPFSINNNRINYSIPTSAGYVISNDTNVLFTKNRRDYFTCKVNGTPLDSRYFRDRITYHKGKFYLYYNPDNAVYSSSDGINYDTTVGEPLSAGYYPTIASIDGSLYFHNSGSYSPRVFKLNNGEWQMVLDSGSEEDERKKNIVSSYGQHKGIFPVLHSEGGYPIIYKNKFNIWCNPNYGYSTGGLLDCHALNTEDGMETRVNDIQYTNGKVYALAGNLLYVANDLNSTFTKVFNNFYPSAIRSIGNELYIYQIESGDQFKVYKLGSNNELIDGTFNTEVSTNRQAYYSVLTKEGNLFVTTGGNYGITSNGLAALFASGVWESDQEAFEGALSQANVEVNGDIQLGDTLTLVYKTTEGNGKIINALFDNDTIRLGADNKLYADQTKLNALEAKVDELELFKFPNATIIGDPLINNGQVSEFTVNDYMQFPFILDLHNKPFQIDFAFTTGSDVNTQQNILDSKFGLALAIANGKGLMAVSSNGESWDIGSTSGNMDILPNTTYYARLTWNGMLYRTALSTDGTTYTQDMQLTANLRPFPTTIFIGGCNTTQTGHTPHPFSGTINMNKASMMVQNQVIWQGMDDVGLATRLDVNVNNITQSGIERLKELVGIGDIDAILDAINGEVI